MFEKIKTHREAIAFSTFAVVVGIAASVVTYSLTKEYYTTKHANHVYDLHRIAKDAGVLDTIFAYQDANLKK